MSLKGNIKRFFRARNLYETRVIVFNAIFIFIVFLPVFLWIFWFFTPKKPLRVLIVDKTVLSSFCREHRCFNWVLVHRKYCKPNHKFYSYTKDYLGFFPKKDYQYVIRDVKMIPERNLDSLASYLQMIYYTDTYGIYYNEWYLDTLNMEHSKLIYGGLDRHDYMLLARMKAKKKLIIGEFNMFASPTSKSVRANIENLLQLKWTGWTGRYFDCLDTLVNRELPKWLIRLYKQQHHNQWKFTKSGIAFVQEDERVEVLQTGDDLTFEYPKIWTFPYGQKKFGVPRMILYPYWFDIVLSTDTSNHVLAYYQLSTNHRGDSILNAQRIPKYFPAIYEHLKTSPYYYFCGDWCDNSVNYTLCQIKGIRFFELFILANGDYNLGYLFFWRYYYPLMTKILKDYYKTLT